MPADFDPSDPVTDDHRKRSTKHKFCDTCVCPFKVDNGIDPRLFLDALRDDRWKDEREKLEAALQRVKRLAGGSLPRAALSAAEQNEPEPDADADADADAMEMDGAGAVESGAAAAAAPESRRIGSSLRYRHDRCGRFSLKKLKGYCKLCADELKGKALELITRAESDGWAQEDMELSNKAKSTLQSKRWCYQDTWLKVLTELQQWRFGHRGRKGEARLQ